MLVWKDTRRTYAEVATRARNLAGVPPAPRDRRSPRAQRARAVGVRPGDRRAAALQLPRIHRGDARLLPRAGRAVQRQPALPARGGSRACFDMLGAEAVVYHRALGPLVARGDARSATSCSSTSTTGRESRRSPGSTSFEEAAGKDAAGVSLPVPSPDDLYLVCTGGTTGSPKGVLWRQGDIFVAAMGGVDGASRENLAERAAAGAGTWFAAPPLMHAAAQWTAFAAIHSGATLVLHDDTAAVRRARDPRDDRARARQLHLDRRRRVRAPADRGAAQDELRPRVAADGSRPAERSRATPARRRCSSCSRTSRSSTATAHRRPAGWRSARRCARRSRSGFAPAAGAAVLSADRSPLPRAGRRRGRLDRAARARSARLPRRPRRRPRRPSRSSTASASPFRAIARGSPPDGVIVLLGRDSLVVNSGGEKIFVEEVEDVLRRHPDVVDALVVGRPSDRFGEEVVGHRPASPRSDARSVRAARVHRAVDRPLQGAARDRVLRARPAPCERQGRLSVGALRRGARGGCRRTRGDD